VQSASGRCEVPGLAKFKVASLADVAALVDRGNARRAVGAHDVNAQSSRSHQIVTLHIEGNVRATTRAASTTAGAATSPTSVRRRASKLHLVDLAGSERLAKTDATGDRLREAQHINKSLSALGDVVNALSAGARTSSAASTSRSAPRHVPYRNSKLTYLLQDSLSGDAKALMFVTVSPAPQDVPETLCSLKFAARCRDTALGRPRRHDGLSSSSSSPENHHHHGNGAASKHAAGGLSSPGGGASSGSSASVHRTPLRSRTSSSGSGGGPSRSPF